MSRCKYKPGPVRLFKVGSRTNRSVLYIETGENLYPNFYEMESTYNATLLLSPCLHLIWTLSRLSEIV